MTPETTDMDLMRFACRTEVFYMAMINEYKRNFEHLLCGCFETAEQHAEAYTRIPDGGDMDLAFAEKIINDLASNAYAQGKSITK